MKNPQLIHEKILDYLIDEYNKNSAFYFATRQRNTYGRLDKGYWFQGNDEYVYVSFWEGGDQKRKVNNIGFVVNANTKESWIELSAKEDTQKIHFLQVIASRLGFFKGKVNGLFYKRYNGKYYLENMKSFLEKEKKEIDNLIIQYQPIGIEIIKKTDFEKKYKSIIARREEQILFGKKNKIARLCWNEEGWKFPSGMRGKSMNSYSYENHYGFGHEEWLFDKSRDVDGYHYAFIEAFRIKSRHHVNKTYNVKLYSINSLDNRKYYVGEIKNLIVISEKESERMYNLYSKRGWLEEMIQQVNVKGGKWKSTIAEDSSILFNVKFRFIDAVLFDEYQLIAEGDININSTHFVLLPLKTEVCIEIELKNDEEEDCCSGNYKNINQRSKTINQTIVYDPYHDKIQNALYDLLKKWTRIYKSVHIEKNRVDLKAKTISGEWHYFEIKTDSAKLSIRKAIGQIMEYSFYPNKKRASRLIVISDSKPLNDDIVYLKFIRSTYSLPIYYRYFVLEKNKLSKYY